MQNKEEKTLQDTEKFVRMVASHQGWELNQDADFVAHLEQGLTDNYNRYGFYLCPCRDSWGDRQKDRDITCPCVYVKPDQEEHGHCFCGLFLTREFARTGKTPQQIPERRPDDKMPD